MGTRLCQAPGVAVLSGWGMLAGDRRSEIARTHIGDAGQLDAADLPQQPSLEAGPAAEPRERRRVYRGGWREVPVFELDALTPGRVIEAPAIVGSATTTMLLRPHDRARLARRRRRRNVVSHRSPQWCGRSRV